MTKQKKGYSVRANDFRNLCRGYTSQKKWLYALEREKNRMVLEKKDQDREGKELIRRMDVQIRLLQENLVRTEDTIEMIEEKYGEEAGQIVYQAYVEQRGMKAIAAQNGISVRTLQRKIRTWLENVL